MGNQDILAKINILDSQAHIGPGGIEETKAAMDALGIRSLLIDEFWIAKMMEMQFAPVHPLGNGVTRPVAPTAELAAQLYPERFSYVLRVANADSDAETIIRLAANAPGCKGIRIEPGMSPLLVSAFAAGGYDQIFVATMENNMPLFIYLPDHPELLAVAAERFPDLTMVVDHCGLYSNDDRVTFRSTYQNLSFDETISLFEKVLDLSKYPNVILKWSHLAENFGIPAFPGIELRPLLRRPLLHLVRRELSGPAIFLSISAVKHGRNCFTIC